MTAFKLSLRTTTPLILNKWLMLDAILDGILDQDGVPAEARQLPLAAWNGQEIVNGLTSIEAKERGAVFMASATFAGPSALDLDIPRYVRSFYREAETKDDRPVASRGSVDHPPLSSVTWKGGTNPTIEFNGGEFPFAATGKRFDIARGPTGAVMRRQRTILPTRFEWLAQGDPDRVLEILDMVDGIGAKNRNGFGQIDRDSIEIETVLDAPKLFGVVAEDGSTLVRPVPADLFEGSNSLDRFHHRVETCVAPYWNRANEVHALVPRTTIDSLLIIQTQA